MNTDEDDERVDAAINLLAEHFDTVHIFVSRHEPATENGTIHAARGVGHWFARYGQIKEWMIREEECSRIKARKDNE